MLQSLLFLEIMSNEGDAVFGALLAAGFTYSRTGFRNWKYAFPVNKGLTARQIVVND